MTLIYKCEAKKIYRVQNRTMREQEKKYAEKELKELCSMFLFASSGRESNKKALQKKYNNRMVKSTHIESSIHKVNTFRGTTMTATSHIQCAQLTSCSGRRFFVHTFGFWYERLNN